LSVAGADRALRDVEAAMGAILAMPFVDHTRVVIGGQSRGGILSVAYVGRHAEQVRGVINFVGGWNGSRCQHSAAINQSIFVRGARFPGDTLWLTRSIPCRTAARASMRSRPPAGAGRFTSCRRNSAGTTSGGDPIGGRRSSRPI
jgi:dienelactone hydrolase